MPAQLLCNTIIDYSTLPGSALPFTIELDLVNSNLDPAPGEFQKFCYIVTGVGADVPTQKDLSHWVLGICEEITEDDIIVESITVVIDEVAQEVIWGTNVELVNPDPTTGCSGIKFDFIVLKVGGVMNVCFELSTPYSIGSNSVCLKGGEDNVEKGLSICGPSCGELPPCETFTYQTATVCVPVVVTPTAIPGTTRTICCGDPVVIPDERACTSGNLHCYFTVSQRVCIEVPVTFGATATVGDARITCEDVGTDGCMDCD